MDAVEAGPIQDTYLLAVEQVIARATAAEDETTAVLATLETAATLPGVEAACFHRVDRARGRADLRHAVGMAEHTRSRFGALELSMSPFHSVFLHRQPVFVDDVAAGDPCAELMAPFTCIAMVPVVAHDDVTGAVSALRHGPHDWSPEEQLVLPCAGRELGGALARLEARRALHDRHLPMRDLFDTVGELLMVTTDDGRLLWANDAAERRLGVAGHGSRTTTFLDFFPPGDRLRAAASVAELLDGREQAMDVPLLAHDGERIAAETHVRWGTWDDRRVLFFLSRAADTSSAPDPGDDTALLQGLLDIILLMTQEHDPITAVHSRRVAELATLIGRRLDLDARRIAGLRLAGELHDIGKFTIPSEVLLRPAGLSGDEFALIRAHPATGSDIVRATSSPWPLAETILQHHERLDGSGYPRGLQGDGILTEARILAVADVFEAMSARRPYRSAHSVEEALEELRSGSGRRYDADVVAACEQICRDGRYTDVVELGPPGAG